MSRLPITWMYCPAIRTDLLEKAYRSEADVVIFDLEDAVLPSQKEEARALLRKFMEALPESGRGGGRQTHVRINAMDTEWAESDLRMINEVGGFDGIRIPKVESSAEVEKVHEAVAGPALHALIETAAGLSSLDSICASPPVAGVSLGDADIRTALHLSGESALDHFRVSLALALAAHGKPAPVGAVYTNIRDLDGLFEHTRHLRSLGFIGRTILHPKQLDTVRRAFAPTGHEVSAAQQIIELAASIGDVKNSGAFTMPDGRFIDAPLVRQAQDILDLHEAARAQLSN